MERNTFTTNLVRRPKVLTNLLIVFFVFISLPYTVQAQFDYTAFHDDFYPKSAQAEALAKYIDYPVDKSSGAINISVPIYTIKVRGFELPISLDYHTGGLKVDQLATSTGLGWVLSAGGMITRSVKGSFPDDAASQGYLLNGKIPDNYSEILALAQPPWPSPPPDWAWWDMQPDMFYLNCAGLTGSFMHDYLGNIHLIPEQDIKIEDISTTGIFKSWQVTRPDGVKFVFRDTEKSQVRFKIWNGQLQDQYLSENNITSSWMVNEIITPQNETIEFIYAPEERVEDFIYGSWTGLIYQYPHESGVGTSWGQLYPHSDILKTQRIRPIQEIRTQSEVIKFEYGDQRQDLKPGGDGTAGSNSRVLEYIDVYDRKSNTRIKRFHLVTGYFSAIWPGTPLYSTKRLRLDKVEILDGASLKIAEYGLGYNVYNATAYNSFSWSKKVPPRLSTAADHWGYYNGHDDNIGLLPTHLGRSYMDGNYQVVQGANRTVDVEAKKVFILDEVKYPTGGVAKFYYDSDAAYYAELNTTTQQYENAHRPAGGLVVKRTVYDAGDGSPVIEKLYEYGTGYLALGSPQHQVLDYPSETRGIFVDSDCYPDGGHVITAVYSTPVNDQVSGTSNRVVHYSVTERQPGNGKITYSFNSDAGGSDTYISDAYSEGHPRTIVKPFMNFNQPLEIAYYNENGTVVKKIKNRYKTYYRTIISEGSYYAVTKTQGICGSRWASNPVYTGFTFMDRSEEEIYDGSNVIKQISEYTFNHLNYIFDGDGYIRLDNNPLLPVHHQPTSVQIDAGQGEVIKKEVRYTIDIPVTERPQVIQQMVDGFLITRPVENKTSVIKSGATSVVDGQYLSYQNFNGYFDIADVYRFNASEPVAASNFTFGTFAGGQFNVNLNFFDKTVQYKFNSIGRLIEQRRPDNTPVSFAYHPYAVNPVSVLVNASAEQVAHTGFEEPDTQDWQTGQLTKYDDQSAARGRGRALFPSGSVFSSPVMPAGAYVVSFYAKPEPSSGSSSIIVNGSGVQIGAGAFRKCSVAVTLGSAARIPFTSSGASIIDEVIIHPADARITEYSYKPVLGITSQSDVNNMSTSFQYDAFGRLETIKDNFGNILKGYQYKYVTGQ